MRGAVLVGIAALILSAAAASAAKPRLGRAPLICRGASVLPMSTPPAPWGRLLGGSPLWLGVYAHVQPQVARVRVVADRFYRRAQRGWPVKVLWVAPRTEAEPIRISFTNADTGKRVWIRITGLYVEWSQAPVLDPARPSHPDDPSRPETHEWGSGVYFPKAGCYSFKATWPGGGEGFTFAFGR